MADRPRLDQLCFIDSETQRLTKDVPDVTEVGAYRYARHARPVIWSYAIGDAPVQVVSITKKALRLNWADMPEDLRAFHARVEAGDAWYVAWNAGFDRQIWNSPNTDYPGTAPEHWMDAMFQATASGLPGKLADAGRFVGMTQKLEQGGKLVSLFEPVDAPEPLEVPDDWALYEVYAADDVNAMRDVWRATRALTFWEWEQYWASEAINDRGMMIDRRLAAAATVVMRETRVAMNEKIEAATGGDIRKVTQSKALLEWALDYRRVGARQDALDRLVKLPEVVRKRDGKVMRPVKYTLGKEHLEALLVYYDTRDDLTPDEQLCADVLLLREGGASSTPAKFLKALVAAGADGVLRGQYVCGGAQQTRRFSSRGVQIHNLTRNHLGDKEVELIMDLVELQDARIDALLKETAS